MEGLCFLHGTQKFQGAPFLRIVLYFLKVGGGRGKKVELNPVPLKNKPSVRSKVLAELKGSHSSRDYAQKFTKKIRINI